MKARGQLFVGPGMCEHSVHATVVLCCSSVFRSRSELLATALLVAYTVFGVYESLMTWRQCGMDLLSYHNQKEMNCRQRHHENTYKVAVL